jgi:site-specific DNA-adenine methylase
MSKSIVQNTTTLKSPIGRVGGKSKLSKEIVAQFPEHKHYVEVF